MVKYIQVGAAPEQIDLENDIESFLETRPLTYFLPASKAALWDEKHECYVIIEGGITQAHEVRCFKQNNSPKEGIMRLQITRAVRPRELCELVLIWTEMNLQVVVTSYHGTRMKCTCREGFA